MIVVGWGMNERWESVVEYFFENLVCKRKERRIWKCVCFFLDEIYLSMFNGGKNLLERERLKIEDREG